LASYIQHTDCSAQCERHDVMASYLSFLDTGYAHRLLGFCAEATLDGVVPRCRRVVQFELLNPTLPVP